MRDHSEAAAACLSCGGNVSMSLLWWPIINASSDSRESKSDQVCVGVCHMNDCYGSEESLEQVC